MTNQAVLKHFNSIASLYDEYKRRNRIYYQTLMQAVKKQIPNNNCTILDIGCGTGSILSFLKPHLGIGIDNSSEMIKLAKDKYKHLYNLKFRVHDIEKRPVSGRFDYILLLDVIEHLQNINQAMENICKIMNDDTLLIVSMVNPVWEPILILMEKLHLKMPEGPHYRIGERQLLTLMRKFGLSLKKRSVYFPEVNLPLVRNLALIFIYEIKKSRVSRNKFAINDRCHSGERSDSRI